MKLVLSEIVKENENLELWKYKQTYYKPIVFHILSLYEFLLIIIKVYNIITVKYFNLYNIILFLCSIYGLMYIKCSHKK